MLSLKELIWEVSLCENSKYDDHRYKMGIPQSETIDDKKYGHYVDIPLFFYSPAFADELTIYSSEGIQKISIPESADTRKNQDTYRFMGEKCILNCKEEIPESQPTDKTPARETSDIKEKPEQSVTINIYPSEPNPSQYIIVPYKRPHRDHKPPDRPKPPMYPSVNPGTSAISDRFPPK